MYSSDQVDSISNSAVLILEQLEALETEKNTNQSTSLLLYQSIAEITTKIKTSQNELNQNVILLKSLEIEKEELVNLIESSIQQKAKRILELNDKAELTKQKRDERKGLESELKKLELKIAADEKELDLIRPQLEQNVAQESTLRKK